MWPEIRRRNHESRALDLSMTVPPDWFWKALTSLVAAWVAWTSWRQYRVARDKLRLDLFDRRLAVFQEVREVIIAAHDQGEVDLKRYRQSTAEAVFLFGDDVYEYLSELLRKLTELRERGGKLRAATAMYPTSAKEEEIALVDWFQKQPERVRAVFAPYMSFSATRLH
jgi:hypothetical protein